MVKRQDPDWPEWVPILTPDDLPPEGGVLDNPTIGEGVIRNLHSVVFEDAGPSTYKTVRKTIVDMVESRELWDAETGASWTDWKNVWNDVMYQLGYTEEEWG